MLWGICKMNGAKPRGHKSGHALGRRTATHKANGTGSAGNLWGREASPAAV